MIRIVFATLICLTLGATANAQPRELAPSDMLIDTQCYKTGIGRNPRTQAIVQAQRHAQRVGPDGYWRICEESAQWSRDVGDITRGTACGVPAVGIDPVTGVIYAAANPREYVTADGVWQRCPDSTFVAKPVAPKNPACAVPEVLHWSAGTEPGPYVASNTRSCSAAGGGSLRVGQSRAVTNAGVGAHQGVLVLSCAPGVALVVSLATCAEASACVVSNYRASDDGGNTWWTFSGRLIEGETGAASSTDGKTRPVQCVGGRLRLL